MKINNSGLELKYFVLNPTKSDTYGKASRMAIRTYVIGIMNENPKLARDLSNWMDSLNKLATLRVEK